MAEEQRLDYIPVTFTLGASAVDSATRLGTGQKWLNGPLTLVGPRAEIQGPGGAYLRSTGTAPANAQIELRLTGAVDDSKIQLTETLLTLEGGTAVSIVANDSGTVTIGSVTVIADDGDVGGPTSTNHAFQVGPPSAVSSHYQMKIGPRQIMAVEADSLTSSLSLNQDGGAVMVRGFQVAPLRAVSTALAGSAPAATSGTAAYYMQAGKVTVTATAGAASWSFPAAFANGLLSLTVNVVGGGFADVGAFVRSTSSASTAQVFISSGGAAYGGGADLVYMAIGW